MIEGTLTKGLGEGAFFMSIPHYKKQIKDKLGFDAYPGTLNIKIAGNPQKQLDLLKKADTIRIDGHKSAGTEFGGAVCYRARIENTRGAIIVPDLTKHKNTVEFIAPVHLRSSLNLKEGQKIKVDLK